MSRIADWPRLFGYIISSTGWMVPEVELLTLAQANELLEYWSEHPPAHVLLAAMIKARPLRKSPPPDLASAVAVAGGRVSSKPSQAMTRVLDQTMISPGMSVAPPDSAE